MTLVSGGTNLGAFALKLMKVSMASGSTASEITALNVATTDIIGKTVYKTNLNVEVSPGEMIYPVVTAALASGPLYRAMVYVEPRWERPGNITSMRAST